MIPEHVMHELRYIEVYTGKKIRNQRVGAYQSPLRGPGFDFDEHQPYRPGDDVRRIDWNVTARMDAPYVRHTHAERELNVMIAMDVSRSMDIGSAKYSKKEAMTFITGSLVFSALSDQINTGFVAFADQVLVSAAPRRTRAAAWTMLQQCWDATAAAGVRTRMVPMVQYLLKTLKRMSVVFIVSDFMAEDDVLRSKELAILAAHHDVIAVVPEDPSELTLPAGSGYMRVRDIETGRQAAIGLTDRARRRYADEVRQRREALTRAFYRVPMDHVFVPTDRSPVEPLLSLFAKRMNA
ncbi:MAG TPA: DUF58 domain-containing protein [Vicinamibacterales bacterium]|jgi:uncharacterized protein (DUF58 family)|nr:DUF58 domain-containing protein [Vicinamibacterales bacterium]